MEIASEPNTSATCDDPAAMAPASSVIRCWGDWPPATSRIARAGAAATAFATDRG